MCIPSHVVACPVCSPRDSHEQDHRHWCQNSKKNIHDCGIFSRSSSVYSALTSESASSPRSTISPPVPQCCQYHSRVEHVRDPSIPDPVTCARHPPRGQARHDLILSRSKFTFIHRATYFSCVFRLTFNFCFMLFDA